MNVEDFGRFVERLVALGELFDAPLSPGKQLLYFEALRDLELNGVIGGFTTAARACKFFPKPVELRAFVVGDNADHTEAAWQEWKRLAGQIGAYRSVAFDDPAIADTIVAVFGSWDQACAYDESPEMWVAKRKEFDRVYRIMRQRGLNGPKRLAGLTELDNVSKGYAVHADGQPLFDAQGQPLRLSDRKQLEATATMPALPPAEELA